MRGSHQATFMGVDDANSETLPAPPFYTYIHTYTQGSSDALIMGMLSQSSIWAGVGICMPAELKLGLRGRVDPFGMCDNRFFLGAVHISNVVSRRESP